MEVDYEVEVADVVALNLYHQRHSPTLRARGADDPVWHPRDVPRLVAPLAVRPRKCCPVLRDGGISLLVIGVFVLVLGPALSRWGVVRALRRLSSEGSNRGTFGRRRMTITPETVTQAGELVVTTVKWAAVEKIVEDDARAYFFISALNAFILPQGGVFRRRAVPRVSRNRPPLQAGSPGMRAR